MREIASSRIDFPIKPQISRGSTAGPPQVKQNADGHVAAVAYSTTKNPTPIKNNSAKQTQKVLCFE